MKILISKNESLRDWLGTHNHTIDSRLPNFDVSNYSPSDVIYGNLTVDQSHALRDKKITYQHISSPKVLDFNNRDLTLDDIDGLDLSVSKVGKYHAVDTKKSLTKEFKRYIQTPRENFLDWVKKWRHSAFTIWLLTTLSIVSVSWLTDLLAGNPPLWETNQLSLQHGIWIIACFLFYALCSLSLVKLGKSYLPSLRRISVKTNTKPKKVLLLTLSKIEPKYINENEPSVTLVSHKKDAMVKIDLTNKNVTLQSNDEYSDDRSATIKINLTDDIHNDIKLLSELELSGFQWNVTQLFRGLEKHIEEVETIVLIGTDHIVTKKNEKPIEGSREKLSLVKRLLAPYIKTKKCEIIMSDKYLDVNDVGKSYDIFCQVIDDMIKNKAIRESDICLDITGGTAAVSSAGALATIHRNTQFQYVSTTGSNKVYRQDLQLSQSSPE